VFIADDHPMYREGVARALDDSGELEVVGQEGDGRAALDAIRRLAPDVAVLDLRMPGLDGIGITKAITDEGMPTHVVLLSAQGDGEIVLDGIAAGADAYIAKDADRSEICDTVLRIARGERLVGTGLREGMLEAIQTRNTAGVISLSPREREILGLVAGGKATAEIGKELHLSAATVKTHLQHAYEKLGVSDRAAAVAEALRRGLLT
jgi:two-component system, NarL family, nitrate/nitrite response regulator NarL